jgi:hypothetical protein
MTRSLANQKLLSRIVTTVSNAAKMINPVITVIYTFYHLSSTLHHLDIAAVVFRSSLVNQNSFCSFGTK